MIFFKGYLNKDFQIIIYVLTIVKPTQQAYMPSSPWIKVSWIHHFDIILNSVATAFKNHVFFNIKSYFNNHFTNQSSKKATHTLSYLGVCKKPTNRTNRPKPTEPLPNFRFSFGSVRFRFHYLKTEIFGFGFGVGFFHPKPNRTDRIYIYLCNSLMFLISGLVVCYVVVLLVIPGSSLRVGACVFLLFNFLKP